jgi:hypothetical protein
MLPMLIPNFIALAAISLNASAGGPMPGIQRGEYFMSFYA